jgi:hypothetical protein
MLPSKDEKPRVRKNELPLPGNRQVNADPSIRRCYFDKVNGQPLAWLHNTSVREI